MRKLGVGLMVMSMVVLSNVGVLALPEDGLMLHFAFDGGSVDGDTVKDLSGQGNDATINGGAKVANGGLEFDGADGYVGGDPLEMRTGGETLFSALCWFKTDESSNGPLWMWGDNAIPSSSGDAEAPVGWRSSSGKFAAGFYSGGHFYADAKETYADGEWHFVAQVGDGGTGYLYVDGEQISSTTAGYVYSSSPYFILGARSKNSGSDIDDVEYFSGVIRQVALYNVALGEADIKTIAVEAMAVSYSSKLATTWGRMKN
jgi:hypothetical protein